MGASEGSVGQAQRARDALSLALVLFRWAALAWMVVLAVLSRDGFSRPGLAWIAVAVAAAWTGFASRGRPLLSVELAIALAIVVVSGLVVDDIGARPFFATAWPVAAVAAWAIARGPVGGVLAALCVGTALLVARLVNGIALSSVEWSAVANGTVTYVLAGGAVGVVAQLLERSAAEYQAVVEESMRARERAARLAERESLARQIHDSVLQALAMVHKRGRELSATLGSAEVGSLAEMAGEQERELRSLILREPEEPPTGQASLRSSLEQVARAVQGVPVTVTAVGPVWVDAARAAALSAAVKQALDNVVEHAGATRATVFAEIDAEQVVVTVRDDGRGFTYDEDALRAQGKAGLLKSVKGRVEELGGRMIIMSSSSGTEIELRAPLA